MSDGVTVSELEVAHAARASRHIGAKRPEIGQRKAGTIRSFVPGDYLENG